MDGRRRGQVLLAVGLGLLALLGVVGVLGAAGQGATSVVAAPERATAGTVTETLMILYADTDGDNWTNNDGWGTGDPYCAWYGVTCEEGEIIRLSLWRNDLSGTLPSELGRLSSLQTLHLGWNNLTGAIPPEIGNLSNLQTLALWDNRLSGDLPLELGDLWSVEYLDLSSNRLSGAIPSTFGDLGNLQYLDLSDNDLSGAIPPELGRLTCIFPPDLCPQPGLRTLFLYDNDLSGVIPPELGRLACLETLNLSGNNLGGFIPAALTRMGSLGFLSVADNPYLSCWETEEALAWALQLTDTFPLPQSNPYPIWETRDAADSALQYPTYYGPMAVCFYVDEDADGANNGASWRDAFVELQQALAVTLTVEGAGAEFWVAEGVYTPDYDLELGGHTGSVTATFQLRNGYALYGGFVGWERGRHERVWSAHPTVLSGDLAGDDLTDAYGAVTDAEHINGDNSYHVVTASGVDGTAVLDGFTVTGGNATVSGTHDSGGGMVNAAGSPTVGNAVFRGNRACWGGGMANEDGNPILLNVILRGNTARDHGGGIDNGPNASPTLTNVVFWNNQAVSGDGGGMRNAEGSNPTLTNVTLADNQAGAHGGGIANAVSSSPTLTNCILWGNSAPVGAQISNEDGTSFLNYSLVQDGCPDGGVCDDHVLTADPLFKNGARGDLRLQLRSPAIDVGDNMAVAGIATDLAGLVRIINGTVDLGAYETRLAFFLPFAMR